MMNRILELEQMVSLKELRHGAQVYGVHSSGHACRGEATIEYLIPSDNDGFHKEGTHMRTSEIVVLESVSDGHLSPVARGEPDLTYSCTWRVPKDSVEIKASIVCKNRGPTEDSNGLQKDAILRNTAPPSSRAEGTKFRSVTSPRGRSPMKTRGSKSPAQLLVEAEDKKMGRVSHKVLVSPRSQGRPSPTSPKHQSEIDDVRDMAAGLRAQLKRQSVEQVEQAEVVAVGIEANGKEDIGVIEEM